MELRIGQGLSEQDRLRAVETLYAAARTFPEPRLGKQPFAPSQKLREIGPRFSAKSWTTIHRALKG